MVLSEKEMTAKEKKECCEDMEMAYEDAAADLHELSDCTPASLDDAANFVKETIDKSLEVSLEGLKRHLSKVKTASSNKVAKTTQKRKKSATKSDVGIKKKPTSNSLKKSK